MLKDAKYPNNATRHWKQLAKKESPRGKNRRNLVHTLILCTNNRQGLAKVVEENKTRHKPNYTLRSKDIMTKVLFKTNQADTIGCTNLNGPVRSVRVFLELKDNVWASGIIIFLVSL